VKSALLALGLLLAPALAAQTTVPAGSVLPVRLDTGLNARHVKPGQAVRATIMQNIPGTSIHRGARVLGQVVAVSPTRLSRSASILSPSTAGACRSKPTCGPSPP
jgi:hypothetical protein